MFVCSGYTSGGGVHVLVSEEASLRGKGPELRGDGLHVSVMLIAIYPPEKGGAQLRKRDLFQTGECDTPGRRGFMWLLFVCLLCCNGCVSMSSCFFTLAVTALCFLDFMGMGQG